MLPSLHGLKLPDPGRLDSCHGGLLVPLSVGRKAVSASISWLVAITLDLPGF
jgi:hypothetical protein